MEEEQSGLTVGDIFRTILSYKWIALIIAVIITIIGVIAINWGYNISKIEYASTFSLDFPGSDELTYPDNTHFNYRDIVSRENLLAVKSSNPDFQSLDVESMYANGDISISRRIVEISEQQRDMTYTISVTKRYFPDNKIASEFIEALANAPVDYVKSLAINQDIYLRSYEASAFYETKTELLSEQASYISNKLNELTDKTGGSLKNDCVQLITKLELFNQKLTSIIGEMRENYYVHDEDEARTTYNNMLVTLNQQYAQKLDALKKAYGDLTEAGNMLPDGSIVLQPTSETVSLASEAAGIKAKIDLYKNYVDNMEIASDEFKTRLSALNTELKEITDEYESNLCKFYEASSLVAYENPLSETGGMSLIMSVAISLVVGIVIGAVVAFILGMRKKRLAADNAEEQTEEVPHDNVGE